MRQRMLGRAGTGSPVRQRGPRLGPCQGAAWRGLDVPKGSSPGTQRNRWVLEGPGQTLSVKSLCIALGASLVAQTVKKSACSAGDLGSIPGSERAPGEGNGNPLQYSCLENPMDRGAWQATIHCVTKSRTRLSG